MHKYFAIIEYRIDAPPKRILFNALNDSSAAEKLEELTGYKVFTGHSVKYVGRVEEDFTSEEHNVEDLNKSLHFLNLSARTSNCCYHQKINSIKDLINLSKKDLLKIPHLGVKGANELITKMDVFGLKPKKD